MNDDVLEDFLDFIKITLTVKVFDASGNIYGHSEQRFIPTHINAHLLEDTTKASSRNPLNHHACERAPARPYEANNVWMSKSCMQENFLPEEGSRFFRHFKHGLYCHRLAPEAAVKHLPKGSNPNSPQEFDVFRLHGVLQEERVVVWHFMFLNLAAQFETVTISRR